MMKQKYHSFKKNSSSMSETKKTIVMQKYILSTLREQTRYPFSKQESN